MRLRGRSLVVGGVVVLLSLGAWLGGSAIVSRTTPSVSREGTSVSSSAKTGIGSYGILYLGEEVSRGDNAISRSEVLDRLEVVLSGASLDVSGKPKISYRESGVVLAEYNKFSVLLSSSLGQLVGFVSRSSESPMDGYVNSIKIGDDLYLHLGLETQGLLTRDGKPLISYKEFEEVDKDEYSELGLDSSIEVMSSSVSELSGSIEVDGYVYSVDSSVLAYKRLGSVMYYYKSVGVASSPYWVLRGISSEKLNLESVTRGFLSDGVLSYGVYSIGGETVWLGLS